MSLNINYTNYLYTNPLISRDTNYESLDDAFNSLVNDVKDYFYPLLDLQESAGKGRETQERKDFNIYLVKDVKEVTKGVWEYAIDKDGRNYVFRIKENKGNYVSGKQYSKWS